MAKIKDDRVSKNEMIYGEKKKKKGRRYLIS